MMELLNSCKDQIVSFHEHESLLDHKVEEELSELERKAAWAEYEAEVTRRAAASELDPSVRPLPAANPNVTALLSFKFIYFFSPPPQSATAANQTAASPSEDNLDGKTDAQLFVRRTFEKRNPFPVVII